MTDRDTALLVMALLRETAVGDTAVLVGSSALFGFATRVQPFTEDIDVCLPEALAAERGDEIAAAVIRRGFEHQHGTATFARADGTSFDLLGHGDPGLGDHIAGTGELRVMVFEDLSRVLAAPGATCSMPEGTRSLSPAGFVVSKILTERAHKGAKDKIQALLVIAERAGDPSFARDCVLLLGSVEPVRLEDARASCEEAMLALSGDPLFRDAGAEGYAPTWRDAGAGLEQLRPLLDAAEAGGHG